VPVWRPAFQAVRVTSALELRVGVGAALSRWGCDVRGAEHRACRSGDRRSKPFRWSGWVEEARLRACGPLAGLKTGAPPYAATAVSAATVASMSLMMARLSVTTSGSAPNPMRRKPSSSKCWAGTTRRLRSKSLM